LNAALPTSKPDAKSSMKFEYVWFARSANLDIARVRQAMRRRAENQESKRQDREMGDQARWNC
jgi:hypothetical protein